MVAKHDYPFEHEYFRVFINGICPMFKWVSRTTLEEDVMQLYNESRTEVTRFFDKLPSKVSFTTDMWTPDYQNIGYCCVTCHYIDDEWVLRKKIIAYLTVPTPHSGVVLSEVIKAQALAWNVDRKLFAITVDNASNNNTMVVELKDWLKRKGVLCLDARIRLSGEGVSMDVPTRWNSTYDMLSSAIRVVEPLALSELASDYKHLPSLKSGKWELKICVNVLIDWNRFGCEKCCMGRDQISMLCNRDDL
ncbi:hypothetical protein IFM89_027994 [Coptis chinensis]|uniref:Transposase n=1 Tax=Coptis chinensis TaxID=261450 RepID=A0A835LFA0_9MAGN|nr:hypothetical protein IFM89_027994 [Coptis chinensis]